MLHTTRVNLDKLVNCYALLFPSGKWAACHPTRLSRAAGWAGVSIARPGTLWGALSSATPRTAAVSGRSQEPAAPGARCCLGFPPPGGRILGDDSPAGAATAAGPWSNTVPTPPGARPTPRGSPGVRPGLLQNLGRAQGERRPRTCPRAPAQRRPAAAARTALRSTRPAARASAPTAASAPALRLLQRRAVMT